MLTRTQRCGRRRDRSAPAARRRGDRRARSRRAAVSASSAVAGMNPRQRRVRTDFRADRLKLGEADRGSIVSAARVRPPPSSTTARPTARVSIATTKPRPLRHGVERRPAPAAERYAALDRKSFGPPSAATMRSNRSAAAPESSVRCSAARGRRRRSFASPQSARSSAPSASVTSMQARIALRCRSENRRRCGLRPHCRRRWRAARSCR